MIEVFDYFKRLFNLNNFRLYMIGSSSRDYLLNKEILDFDFVTDATPDKVLSFLKCDESFKKFGILKTKYLGNHIDIATLRKEENYFDFRHPSKLTFVKTIKEDFIRRDFTINAIYIDENYNVIDPSNLGITDLKEKKLRFIGDPLTRIKEDPIRILRALRFVKEYNLKVDELTKKIIKENFSLINNLNENKVKEEKRKYYFVSKGEDYNLNDW